MDNIKEYPYLRNVIFRMLIFRLFIPLGVLILLIGIGVGYYGKLHVNNSQKQITQSISHIVDYHIDYGGRILDAIAKAKGTSEKPNLNIFINSVWNAYGYFETIYCLDKDKKITMMAPSDPSYTGIDMSNLPDIKENNGKEDLIISRPFISLRTGDPIVYLIRPIPQDGYIVGELNLSLFQKEIENVTHINDQEEVFIMDQAGTLISHPSSTLVKEQTNMSNLEIFHKVSGGIKSGTYTYNDKLMIGNAVKLERTGWIVVDQLPLSTFISSYALIIIIAIISMFIIGIALIVTFHEQINSYVIIPLEQLTKRTNLLANGEFSDNSVLPAVSTRIAEIHNLMVDFQVMSDNLQAREAALMESENRYRGLAERLPIGLFRAKMDGQILGVNPMGIVMLGYNNVNESLEINIANFLASNLINKKKEKFMLENIHNLNNFEIEIKNNNGEIIWILVNTHIVNGSKYKFLEGSIQDITKRKQSEIKYREQQILLFKSEKEKREALEKALSMRDEFISLISHEFKTPLNVIYCAIQLIETVYYEQIPERVKQLIGNIKMNTFRQLRLANNLLDITRMNSGQIKFNFKNMDIVFLTKMISQSIEPYASKKNINIYFKSDMDSKIVSIDEEKYERIILNILSNAMKFTENDGNITISLIENINPNYITVKISDTGIGIPDDKKQLIFERFGQVDSNLSRRAEGTGIGLSLVKLIVDNLGGEIEVQSELGVGSTFTIILPINVEVQNTEMGPLLDIDDRLVSEIKVQFSDIYL